MVLWWQVVRDQRTKRADLWYLISSHPSRDGHAAQESLCTALQQCLSVCSGMAPDPPSLCQSSLPTHLAYSWAKTHQVQHKSLHSKCGCRHPSPAGWDFCWSKEALPPSSYLVVKRHFPQDWLLLWQRKKTWSFQTSIFLSSRFCLWTSSLDTHWVLPSLFAVFLVGDILISALL